MDTPINTGTNIQHPDQPPLFDFEDLVWGTLELFPAVWGAAEGLISEDLDSRRCAFERIRQWDAARKSALIAYLLGTRLNEPNLELRKGILEVLGEVFTSDESGRMAPADIRFILAAYLTEMRTRQIYALLECLVAYPEIKPAVIRLLNVCPYASNHLIEIINSRHFSNSIRRQAVRCIGWLGFLTAVPALERMQEKLAARINNQEALPFISQPTSNDAEMLVDIQTALKKLKSP